MGEPANTILKDVLTHWGHVLPPELRERIDNHLKVDPLHQIPDWVEDAEDVRQYDKDVRGNIGICLGRLNDFAIGIVHNYTGQVQFDYGCRTIMTEASARDYWKNDYSKNSGEPRPNSQACLDWVAAICKHRGWEW